MIFYNNKHVVEYVLFEFKLKVNIVIPRRIHVGEQVLDFRWHNCRSTIIVIIIIIEEEKTLNFIHMNIEFA